LREPERIIDRQSFTSFRFEKVTKQQFKIRRATLSDLDILVYQRHRMFEDIRHRNAAQHKLSDGKYRKWAAKKLKNKSLIGFLAEGKSGEILGGGCVWLKDSQPSPGSDRRLKSPYLMSMYTKPRHRGKGIATAIVTESMAWCRKRGYRTMLLHASEAGRPVYSKLGWKRTWEMRVDLAGERSPEDHKRRT
jgi:GNAT superfamily N-acetyltransferase